MFPRNEGKPANITVSLILSTIFLSSIAWTIEKFILQFFRAQFHQKAYSDRITNIEKIDAVLERLSKGVRKRVRKGSNLAKDGIKVGLEKETGNDTLQEIVVEKSNATNPSNGDLNFKKKSAFRQKAMEFGSGFISISKATFGLDLKNGGGGIRHFGNPYKLAKRLFLGIRRENASSLYMRDFEPFYADTLERVAAFRVFDTDENGDVTRSEFRQGINHMRLMYNQQSLMCTKTMKHSKQACFIARRRSTS
jgi:hypothetical protein